LPFDPSSQLPFLSIASARLVAAVPNAVLSNNRRAAGVKFASVRRGVHVGGAILPFFPVAVRGVNISAFARRLFDALLDSLWEMTSRAEISGIRKGV